MEQDEAGSWSLMIRAKRFLQSTVVAIPGFEAEDNWFHLAPGEAKCIQLQQTPDEERDDQAAPKGQLTALNFAGHVPF